MTVMGESREATFDKVYVRFRDAIERSARRQYVPGLDAEDVASEMTDCLWEAIKTYQDDLGVTLGAYWWSIWKNRKVDLIRAANAVKRPKMVCVEDLALLDRVLPPVGRILAPPGSSSEEEKVWELLAQGQGVVDVLRLTGLSRRQFYNTMRKWQTDDIYEYLTG